MNPRSGSAIGTPDTEGLSQRSYVAVTGYIFVAGRPLSSISAFLYRCASQHGVLEREGNG